MQVKVTWIRVRALRTFCYMLLGCSHHLSHSLLHFRAIQIHIFPRTLYLSILPPTRLTNQSHICLTFKLTLFSPIQPSSSIGQSANHAGQLPATTLGTECHAHRLPSPITTTSPDRILTTNTSDEPSMLIRNIASQPIERLTSAADEDSEMSRCGESMSPGE